MPTKDFFISYSNNDEKWAEWIAWQLEEAGYTTDIQAWDFAPGSDFVKKMHDATINAERTIAVLSNDYLESAFAQAEWGVAFSRDPKGEKGILVPVRVGECSPEGLLRSRVYIDLVGLTPAVAKNKLLKGIGQDRTRPVLESRQKPDKKPKFPGTRIRRNTNRRSACILPAICNIPYLRNPNFTGRDQVLKDLRNALTSGKPPAVPQAITGLGGVGKTQIAVEYAYRFASDYEIMWWIRAEEAATLTADFAALAVELKLTEEEVSEPGILVKVVRRWLSQGPAPWLLIFDNAQTVKDIRDYIPPGNAGHVIITSRNPNWRSIGSTLSLDVLDRDEAVSFLLGRTGSTEGNAAATLAELLGDLPLALEQAGAYIEETPSTISDYSRRFRNEWRKLFRHRPQGDPHATVATIWEISFEQVKGRSPGAQDLLSLCAFLAPDEIPLDVLRRWATKNLRESLARVMEDEDLLDDVVSALRQYSLAKVKPIRILSVHRLVQAVGRDRLDKEDKEWAVMAVHLLSEAFQFDSDDISTWPACNTLLPHALAATEYARELQVEDGKTAQLLTAVGRFSVGRREFVKVKATFEQALEIDEKIYGENHPKVAEDATNLGFLLKDQGDLSGAGKYFERALKINQDWFGASREAALSLNNLGLLLKDLHDFEGAREHFQKALAMNATKFGPQSPEVVLNLNNLGYLLKDNGDLDGAQKFFEDALKINESAYGPKHPSVATSLNNLGIVLKDKSDFDGAQEHFERAFEIAQASYGLSHPQVASCLNNLGFLAKDRGSVKEAKVYLERALAIAESAYGTVHINVARSLSNLGSLLTETGDLANAQKHFERALSINEAAFGSRHAEVAMNLSQLGNVRHLQNDLNGARSLYKRALNIFQKMVGEADPRTQNARTKLMSIAGEPSEKQKAARHS